MKLRSISAILITFVVFLMAQTNVSGIIYDGTWTPDGSPYILDGDLTVYGLAVEPGVTVQSTADHSFEVHGQIHAIGTYQDSIYFQPAAGADSWSGIYFLNSGLQSVFKYCVMEYAAESAIACDMSPELVLENSRISFGGTHGIWVGEDAVAHVSNSIISYNTQSGLDVDGTVDVYNSIISYNGLDGINIGGVGEIVNNTIVYNQGYGIDNNDNSGLSYQQIMNSIVFFNNDDGEQIDGAYNTVTYSIVQDGYDGIGNQAFNPLFAELETFVLTPISTGIDGGHPSSDYDDYCFSVSQGEARNDIGAYGGPYACSWLEFVYGCMDDMACNYHPTVNTDDGSCLYDDCNGDCGGIAILDDCDACVEGETGMEFNYAIDDCGVCFGANLDMDCFGICFGDAYLDDCGVCDADPENDNLTCQGCMDPFALNYDPEALFDDGSCEYQEITVNIPTPYGSPGDIVEIPIEITVPFSLPIYSCSMAIACPDSGFVVTDVTLGQDFEDLGWIMEFNANDCPAQIWATGAQSVGGTHLLFTVEVELTEVFNSQFAPINFVYLLFDETYYFINYEGGGVDVIVPDFGDVSMNGFVSAFDAGLILQYLVEQVEFEVQQEMNAEVSGDDTISAYDASLILQYGVGLIDEFPAESAPFSLLATGDMYMEDQVISMGSSFSLPVWLENGGDIYSFELELDYNTDHLTLTDIEGGENIDTFTVNFSDESGLIRIAGASAYPDGETGIFLNLNFDVDDTFENHMSDVYMTKMRLNENAPVLDGASTILYNQDVATGDLNQDYQVDILDVIAVVLIIMDQADGSEYQYFAGDLNNDGELDILDVIELVNVIIAPVARSNSVINRADIILNDENILIQAGNAIAGVQMKVEGEFDLSSAPAGWELHHNANTILLYTMDGTGADQLEIGYTGLLEIEEAMVADWSANGVIADLNMEVSSFSLGKAFPNPFNPVTEISYTLKMDGDVNIAIYDMLGREVSELVSAQMTAGTYSAVWDAAGQASGLYMVRMTANDMTQTGKLMLLK